MYEEFLTLSNLWVDQIPTANGYGQLVTPQAIYFIHKLLRKDLAYELNWFRPLIGVGGSIPVMFRTLRALGVRYFIGYDRFALSQWKDLDYLRSEQLRSMILPQRASSQPPGLWLILEFADVNVGNYSPIKVTTAESAAEILSRLGAENFDFTREVVLATAVAEQLVTARGMQMVIIRGGLHVSGHSDGTSLIVLPQQFSNCLRAHDH